MKQTLYFFGTTQEVDRSLANKRYRKSIFNFTIIAIISILMLVSVTLFYVWTRIQVVSLGYEISQKVKERERIEEINRKLKLEVATLKSPRRIERIAIKKLGLRYPTIDQVIILK